MTLDEIEYLASLREAGGHSTMPVPLADWREWMTEKHMSPTKSIGRVKMTNHKTGKVTISPIAKMPVSRKIGTKAKADRKEAGLRANRKGKA